MKSSPSELETREMYDANEQFRKILEGNIGFKDAARWEDYARRNDFRSVKAVKVLRCPDCSSAPERTTWGQYVYYSTLIRLLECANCGLVWADAHIDPGILRLHFETGYKDDQYFRVARKAIFDHLVKVIDGLSPRSGRILDIGGARGDLMAQVIARRPDLTVVVNDISKAATDFAAENFGLATLMGGANELALHRHQYDVVVLSDVLYYESNPRLLWVALSHLVSDGGSVLVRVPNRSLVIRLSQLWYRLTHTSARQAMQDRVRFFNPEHIFICRRRYLCSRLSKMGFRRVHALPSPLLARSEQGKLGSALFSFATGVNQLTRHRLVFTPSMLVVASRFSRNYPGFREV